MKICLVVGLLVIKGAALPAQTNPGTPGSAVRPSLRAAALVAPIVLDGRLNDPVWSTADSIPGLTQVTPVAGATPQSRTVVKVLVNSREIVFGVAAHGATGVPITSYSKARDADLDDEDHISIVLDCFLDGRSGYVFSVNPSGARTDGLPERQGEGVNDSWDGIWDAATSKDGNSWSA